MPTNIPKEDGWYQVRFEDEPHLGQGWHMCYRDTSGSLWIHAVASGDVSPRPYYRHKPGPAEYRGPITLDGLAELEKLRAEVFA